MNILKHLDTIFQRKKGVLWLLFACVVHFLPAQIVNIEDKRVRLTDTVQLTGNVDVSFLLNKNDKQLITLSGSSFLEYGNKKYFIMSLTSASFTKGEGQNFVNEGFQHFRFNRDVTKKNVYEAYVQGQYNERLSLKFRGIGGTGLRFKFRFAKTQRLYLGTSYLLEYTQFSTQPQEALFHRLSNYISTNIQLKQFRFVTTAYYQPVLTDWRLYRLSSESSLNFLLTTSLTFRTTFRLTYDNSLPVSNQIWMYNLSNGIRWAF